MDNNDTYSHEIVLMMMWNKLKGQTPSKIGMYEASKPMIEQKIEMIKAVHVVRKIMESQCFIGVVGMQDAGKTTFLNKMWNLGGETGFRKHTSELAILQVWVCLYILLN